MAPHPQINSDPHALQPQGNKKYLEQSNAGNILALLGSLDSLAMIVVGLRLYVRISMLKSAGADDYIMTAAMILGIGMFICFVGETYNGLGHHYETITLPEQETYLKWVFAHSLCATSALCLVKISIAFFLMRLAPRRSWQWFLWSMIVFLMCFTIASLGTLIFACVPVQASWDLELLKTAKCFSAPTFVAIGMWNAITGVVTDFLFATIPIPIVMHLSLNLRTKLTLAGVMSLGYIACAAAIVKTYYLWHFTADKDRTYHDWFFVMAGIELYLGILSASLPALKRLVTKVLATTRSMLSASKSRWSRSPGYPRENRNSSGYQRQHDWARQLELKAIQPPTPSSKTARTRDASNRGSEYNADIQRPYRARVISGHAADLDDFDFDVPAPPSAIVRITEFSRRSEMIEREDRAC